ncbi:MAG: hypothetical protein WAP23_02015 [Candidatus Spechtbacterales bacterium]
MAKVTIDTGKCLEIAEHIRNTGGVPEDREDPMPYVFRREIAHNGWWAVCSINQQTTPIRGKQLSGTVRNVKLFGWDYLLQRAIILSIGDPYMFTREWLRSVTANLLRSMYRDSENGDTLNQVEVRAELLCDLGEFLQRRGWESVHEAYKESRGYIVRSDGGGLAQVLSGARAYQDPVQKKLFYFLAIMRNQGLWKYKDILNLSSPVNYHEQRGHFRLGTIQILDPALERKVRNRRNITDQEDIEIRFAVRRAIEFIAQLLDITPSMMHYYFWNFFRNCCRRDDPHCESCGNSCGLPERYSVNAHGQCIFAPVCASAKFAFRDMLIEPRIDKTIWQ